MSNFDTQTLEHMKTLCRIDCSPEEDADLTDSLGRILGYMAQLNEVPTDQVKTCRYVLRSMTKNQPRADEPKDLLSREEFLANAPDQIGGMIRTPPVMKAL